MRLLVLGSNSAMAMTIAARFAQEESADLYLASRDTVLAAKRAKDLEIRYGIKTEAVEFDAIDYASHANFYTSLNPKPDGVVLAFGLLGDQDRAQNDFEHARSIIETNFLGAMSILDVIATDFEKRRQGFIIGLSSVAGERGRQSNYVYGTSKAALTTYLSGLRNRLQGRNVGVMTVLPGFVNTKMTDSMDLPPSLTAEPEEVARSIYRAWKKGKDVVYVKWVWRYIMAIIKAIPEVVFKRLNL